MDEEKKSQIQKEEKKNKVKPKGMMQAPMQNARKLSLQILQTMGVTTETNVFERIVNETVRYDAMDDLDTISNEESENRILLCEAFLSFILIFISTILALVAYIARQSSSPIVILPNVTKSDLMEGNIISIVAKYYGQS